MSEGERPRSSWQSWVRSSTARRAAADEPPPPPPPPPPTDSLDVELQWGAVPEAEGASEDDLDVELSWQGGDEPSPVLASRAGDEHGSEEYAGHAHEAVADDDAHEDDDGELLPAVPLLPSIAGRVEALTGLLRSISMRVDGLTAVTDVYRANVTDRIDEYTETVLQLSRQSDQNLDEHRRANERAVSELRRAATERAEAMGQLVGRVEELSTDVGTLSTDVAALRELVEVMIDIMPASAEGSGAAPLTRGDLDDVVDTIADAVVTRIDVGGLVDAVVARMEAAFEVVGDEPSPAAASPADLLDLGLPAVEPEPAPKRGRGRRSK